MIAGVDEAGRGPVIGPMVMAIAACDDEEDLRRLGAADSKLLSPQAREQAAQRLGGCPHEIVALTPAQIDAAVLADGDNLNLLEARTTALLIARLAARVALTKVIIDSPTRSTAAYERVVRMALEKEDPEGATRGIALQCEIKADANHPVVGAASILAKVSRDAAIAALAQAHGPLGSGYPADPATQAFLARNWRDGHEFFRKSWESYRRLAQAPAQSSLSQFSDAKGPQRDTARKDALARFSALKAHGFAFEEPTNPYEAVRMRGGPVTVIAYTTGKLVVQGPDDAKRGALALLSRLKLA